MQFSIADSNSDAARLADFFFRNLTADYISHSELQGYRAVSPGKWADNLPSLLEKELSQRLGRPHVDFPAGVDWKGVVTATERNDLVGIALVACSQAAAVPYGIIEDITIDQRARGRGQGEGMIRWIMDQFKHAKVGRVFLESGVGNHGAHDFFERLGFKQVSIVMMRDL